MLLFMVCIKKEIEFGDERNVYEFFLNFLLDSHFVKLGKINVLIVNGYMIFYVYGLYFDLDQN